MPKTQIYDTNLQKISQDWIAFSQAMDISDYKNKVFRLVANIKVDQDEGYGVAGLWARVEHADGTVGFFDNMADRPITTNTWQLYGIEGTIDKDGAILYFGGTSKRNGVFCFTDIQLYIQSKPGEFEKVVIQNPNFEHTKDQHTIPGWQQGTGKKEPIWIPEYTVRSAIDTDYDINYLRVEAKEIPDIYKDSKHYSNHIQPLVLMLQDIDSRMKNAVQELTIPQLDYRPNPKCSSISALIMHIAALEVYYQIYTFEHRGFNDQEKEQWQIALDLKEKANQKYRDKTVAHYLDIYAKVRKKTLYMLKQQDDEWLQQSVTDSVHTHQYQWLHVLEHQSYHLGQINMIKKLISE